jgi:hypothetical protein
MAECLTVAEVYRMQFLLIERFGGVHGVRDKNAVEAAVFPTEAGSAFPRSSTGSVSTSSLSNC